MTNGNSEQAPGHNRLIHIVINGRHREVAEPKLTYEELVKLAFPEDQPNPDLVYTVAYVDPHGHDGTLVAGQEIHIKEGMCFNVTKTNRS